MMFFYTTSNTKEHMLYHKIKTNIPYLKPNSNVKRVGRD